MANAYFGDHPGRLEIPGEMLKSFVPNPHTPVSHETLLFLNLLKNKSVEPLKPPRALQMQLTLMRVRQNPTRENLTGRLQLGCFTREWKERDKLEDFG